MANVPTQKKIGILFRQSRRDIRHVWETYDVLSCYLPELPRLVKSGKLPNWELERLGSGKPEIRNLNELQGIFQFISKSACPRRTLLDAIGIFEDFCGRLATYVYIDFPGKLSSGSMDLYQSQETKLLNILLDSATREEALERIAEEKIRGIFYGNPLDFFTKDKARLEFGDYFSNELKPEIERYKEVCARRNVLTHSGGRVDRKYLREVSPSDFRLGQKVDLSHDYLRSSLLLLEDLACAAAFLICQNIYKDPPRGGKIKQSWDYLQSRIEKSSSKSKKP